MGHLTAVRSTAAAAMEAVSNARAALVPDPA
jgi:hypothetical protein